MRALVTGAGGFIGRHLCERLRSQGDTVLELDLPEVDIRDRAGVEPVVAGFRPDAIYHLAAQAHVGNSWTEPLETCGVNAFGTAVLLDAVRKCAPGARTLVVSSACVFDGVDIGHPIAESEPVRPRSPYGLSKAMAESLAHQYVEGYGLDVFIVRPFNVTGPGQAPSYVVPALAERIAKAHRNGHAEIHVGNVRAERDFVDVREMAEALNLLMKRARRGATYNICSGAGVSIGAIAAELMALCDSELRLRTDAAPRRDHEVAAIVGDPSLTAKEAGWSSRTPLRTTLSDVLAEWLERIPPAIG